MFYEYSYLLSVNTPVEYYSNSLVTDITRAGSKVNKSEDIKLIRSKKTLLITSV